jgi:hypothetical protein
MTNISNANNYHIKKSQIYIWLFHGLIAINDDFSYVLQLRFPILILIFHVILKTEYRYDN